MPLRLVILLIIGISAYVSVRIVTICHNFEKDSIKGCRARVVRSLTGFFCRLLLLASCMRYSVKKIEYDYSQYLGPDYKDKQVLPKHISTIVSNHSAWIDTLMIHQMYGCAFAAKKELKYVPLAGLVFQALNIIFISREASHEVLNQVVAQIDERQKQIEEEGIYPPLAIFPEGTTSNGTHILPFKRGAFMSLRAVRPVVMKFKFGTISQAYDILPFLPLVLMNLCLCNFKIEVIELPPFLPNDYLFEHH